MQNNLDITKFTFLTEEQIFGNDQLDILKKYGKGCAMTDFSILLGGNVSFSNFTSEGFQIKDRIGWWWTKTPHRNDVVVVDLYGLCNPYLGVESRMAGARPALSYSTLMKKTLNKVRDNNGILEVKYGEYPQMVVSESFSRILEKAYLNKTINKTGKSYTTDSIEDWRKSTAFQARNHIEYEYNGKKYIRVVGDSTSWNRRLSDGRLVEFDIPYWLEVEPINWMIDEKTDIALSKKIIFAGVQFNMENNYKGDFNRTNIKIFMDKYFSKDVVPSTIDELSIEEQRDSILTKKLTVQKKNR